MFTPSKPRVTQNLMNTLHEKINQYTEIINKLDTNSPQYNAYHKNLQKFNEIINQVPNTLENLNKTLGALDTQIQFATKDVAFQIAEDKKKTIQDILNDINNTASKLPSLKNDLDLRKRMAEKKPQNKKLQENLENFSRRFDENVVEVNEQIKSIKNITKDLNDDKLNHTIDNLRKAISSLEPSDTIAKLSKQILSEMHGAQNNFIMKNYSQVSQSKKL